MKKKALITLVIFFSILGIIKLYPEWLYMHKFKYNNYTFYAGSPIDSVVVEIINSTNKLVLNDFLDCNKKRYDVFICNSYPLFWLHTFLGRKPSGASDMVTNNIYIANADFKNNIAFSSDKNGKLKGRSIKSVIAHESAHIGLREKIGLKKYKRLIKTENWKIEGVCEWVAFNDKKIDENQMLDLIKSQDYINNPWHRYRLYRFALTYLIDTKGYNLEDIVAYPETFETVLQELN
ncbi:MAG: hypothetical protein ACOC2E_06945, partial [Bacteroidota bacterium]